MFLFCFVAIFSKNHNFQQILMPKWILWLISNFEMYKQQLKIKVTALCIFQQFGQRGHNENLLMVDLDQHTDMVSFVVEGCLKFDLSTVSPRWPPTKIPELSERTFIRISSQISSRISSPKFHQNQSDYVDKEVFWAYLNNDP